MAIFWKTCTFQGLETKRKEYLELLTERMTDKHFKLVEKVKPSLFGAHLFVQNSDLVFESPDELYWIGIRTVPANEGLMIEFTHTGNPKKMKQDHLVFATSFIIGTFLSILSAYMINRAFLPNGIPTWMISIPLIIFFSIFFAIFLFYTKSIRIWNRQVKQLLIETAKSMGLKQTTPFKRKMVKRGWARVNLRI